MTTTQKPTFITAATFMLFGAIAQTSAAQTVDPVTPRDLDYRSR